MAVGLTVSLAMLKEMSVATICVMMMKRLQQRKESTNLHVSDNKNVYVFIFNFKSPTKTYNDAQWQI